MTSLTKFDIKISKMTSKNLPDVIGANYAILKISDFDSFMVQSNLIYIFKLKLTSYILILDRRNKFKK